MALNRKYPVLVLIIVLSFGVFLNVLSNDFFSDDKIELIENQWIKDISFIPKIFLTHSWGYVSASTSPHYHPMKFLVQMAQYRLFGTDPLGYHLTNVIVHVTASLMVFFIAASLFRQIFDEDKIVFPAAAALLFAAHPIHTEPVAWVSGMSELFMSFFYLLSFLVYINASGQKQGRFLISSILFFVSALFKETAVALLPLYLIYDYSLGKGLFARGSEGAPSGRILFSRYTPFVAAALAYLSLRTYAIKGFIPGTGHAGFTPYQIIINVFPLLSEYLEMLVLPVRLNFLHVFHPVLSFFDGRTLVALAVNTLFVVSVFVAGKKAKGLLLALLWIIIPLFPVLYFPAFTGESVFAERYLYLPSVGFVSAGAMLFRDAYHRKLLGRMTSLVLFPGFAFVIFLCALQTVERNYVWKNDFTVWSDTVKKSPDSSQAYNNLGIAFEDRGQLDQAIICFRKALRLNPYNARAHNNLGNLFYKKGLLDDALSEYGIALALDPGYRDARDNLSVVSSMKEAVTSYKK